MSDFDTIPNWFRNVAAQHPDRPAVLDGETHYTYAELLDLSSAYARVLCARLNLATGQLVMAWLNNGVEFVASFLATAEIGAVFFPLNTNWRTAELRGLLRRLPVAGVVTNQTMKTSWEALAEYVPATRIVLVEELATGCLSQSISAADSWGGPGGPPLPDQAAVYFSSSGSTGVPKIVPRSHRNTVRGAAGTARALNIAAGSRFLSVVPFYHANGFDNSLCLPLFSGCTLVPQTEFVPPRFAETIVKRQIQVMIGSPAIYELLVRFQPAADCLSSLSICASSGGPVAPEIVAEVQQRYGATIRQVYGSSETGVIAVASPEGGPPAMPVPDTVIRIIDADGQSLPAGAEGEITVSGPSVTRGYINAPELSAQVFRGGCFHTGDLGRLDSTGLALLGRIRPVINLSGTKVDPVEVEQVVGALPGVVACTVFAEFVQPGKQVVKAVIAVREGEQLQRAGVIGHCRQFLAEYKIPRLIEFVSALPPDLTGKRGVPWLPGTDTKEMVS